MYIYLDQVKYNTVLQFLKLYYIIMKLDMYPVL